MHTLTTVTRMQMSNLSRHWTFLLYHVLFYFTDSFLIYHTLMDNKIGTEMSMLIIVLSDATDWWEKEIETEMSDQCNFMLLLCMTYSCITDAVVPTSLSAARTIALHNRSKDNSTMAPGYMNIQIHVAVGAVWMCNITVDIINVVTEYHMS